MKTKSTLICLSLLLFTAACQSSREYQTIITTTNPQFEVITLTQQNTFLKLLKHNNSLYEGYDENWLYLSFNPNETKPGRQKIAKIALSKFNFHQHHNLLFDKMSPEAKTIFNRQDPNTIDHWPKVNVLWLQLRNKHKIKNGYPSSNHPHFAFNLPDIYFSRLTNRDFLSRARLLTTLKDVKALIESKTGYYMGSDGNYHCFYRGSLFEEYSGRYLIPITLISEHKLLQHLNNANSVSGLNEITAAVSEVYYFANLRWRYHVMHTQSDKVYFTGREFSHIGPQEDVDDCVPYNYLHYKKNHIKCHNIKSKSAILNILNHPLALYEGYNDQYYFITTGDEYPQTQCHHIPRNLITESQLQHLIQNRSSAPHNHPRLQRWMKILRSPGYRSFVQWQYKTKPREAVPGYTKYNYTIYNPDEKPK